MTRDDILRLAVRCQLLTTENREGAYVEAIERFAALVAAHVKASDGAITNEGTKVDVQPVAWSVFDKRTQKHWYTNESVNTAGYYAKEYSHREPDGSPSMLVVPLYEHPPAAAVQDLVAALMIIAGKQQCVDSLMSNVDIALEALKKWEGK
jgi:hypothetical protein